MLDSIAVPLFTIINVWISDSKIKELWGALSIWNKSLSKKCKDFQPLDAEKSYQIDNFQSDLHNNWKVFGRFTFQFVPSLMHNSTWYEWSAREWSKWWGCSISYSMSISALQIFTQKKSEEHSSVEGAIRRKSYSI